MANWTRRMLLGTVFLCTLASVLDTVESAPKHSKSKEFDRTNRHPNVIFEQNAIGENDPNVKLCNNLRSSTITLEEATKYLKSFKNKQGVCVGCHYTINEIELMAQIKTSKCLTLDTWRLMHTNGCPGIQVFIKHYDDLQLKDCADNIDELVKISNDNLNLAKKLTKHVAESIGRGTVSYGPQQSVEDSLKVKRVIELMVKEMADASPDQILSDEERLGPMLELHNACYPILEKFSLLEHLAKKKFLEEERKELLEAPFSEVSQLCVLVSPLLTHDISMIEEGQRKNKS